MSKTKSKDGTMIAYEKTGSGPAVILVDGAFCGKSYGPMIKIAPLLSENFTVITYDRRARGDSGDTKPYSIEREIEDIDTLIKIARGSAYLFGISSGAILCLKAADSGLNIIKLALLEPPFVGNAKGRRPANAEHQLRDMISQGKKGEACEFYLRKIIGVPAIVPFLLKFTSNWSKMKHNAASLPNDAAVCGDFNLPKKFLHSIKIPTLVIDSFKSPQSLRKAVAAVAEALPNGKRITLKGSVHNVPPKILVPVLKKFFNG